MFVLFCNNLSLYDLSSNKSPFEYCGQDPTCVLLDWLVAGGMMELKKFARALC